MLVKKGWTSEQRSKIAWSKFLNDLRFSLNKYSHLQNISPPLGKINWYEPII